MLMRAHFHPDTRGRYIGMAWGGLFISVWAFGDASVKIDRTLLHVFFFIHSHAVTSGASGGAPF